MSARPGRSLTCSPGHRRKRAPDWPPGNRRTASTRTVTLSRVMPSCAGTGIVTICIFTLARRSTKGTSSVSPGPRMASCTRPKRNTTPRSNCWTTRTLAASPSAHKPAAAATASRMIIMTTLSSSWRSDDGDGVTQMCCHAANPAQPGRSPIPRAAKSDPQPRRGHFLKKTPIRVFLRLGIRVDAEMRGQEQLVVGRLCWQRFPTADANEVGNHLSARTLSFVLVSCDLQRSSSKAACGSAIPWTSINMPLACSMSAR